MVDYTIRSFGRTKGRALSLEQANHIGELLGELRLDGNIPPDSDPKAFMKNATKVWLEIGFGGAEHLIGQANLHPDKLFIGAEPFMDGVAKALRQIEELKLSNVRIIDDDARPTMEKLKPDSIDRVFVLFPDPWHKARHNKRRIFNTGFAIELSRLLKKGGQIRFVTDWAQYAEQAKEIMDTNSDFTQLIVPTKPSHNAQYDIPEDHLTTRYEEKCLGDCLPIFLDFVRN